MAVLISLAGNTAGDGFLVVPLAANYPAELALSTDAGVAAVTLQASPNPAGLVFSQVNVNLSTTPTTVLVHATAQSAARGDTTIQVLDGATVVANFAVTAIKHPVVNFRGRFEARFATQPAFYNQNAAYTAISEAVGPGWTWSLEGEPPFVPAVGSVPENLETPVGRVVRLNNPAALRPHAAAVTSTVDSITGATTSGPQTFTAGDPLIGQSVDLGPDTYFAGNRNINPADPAPEEFFADAFEPMGLFELHLGTMFGGASQVGPFTHKATMINEHTRVPDSRPIATGLVGAAAERAEFGLPTLVAFSETRIDLLVADYNALPPGDSAARRNLARRVGHLLSAVTVAKRNAVQAANPGAFTVRAGTLSAGWNNKEVFNGAVNTNLAFTPSGSAVVAYMSEFSSFDFQWHPFGFHSDELCGHHKGTLTSDLDFHGTYTGDPHTRTVDGTSYDFQAVGEFTLLRDGGAFEVQVRQTPVETDHPITDPHSGLRTCVSIITAVAATVGKHRISLQPGRKGKGLVLHVDGKRSSWPREGLDIGASRVTVFQAGTETGLRVDYPDGTVLQATPAFWNSYNVWYINVSVTHTRADEGLMGYIPRGSWLPRLRDGSDVGTMPADPADRFKVLYRLFADSWRVTDQSSLFTYEAGTSTATFTDPEWPSAKPPCQLLPQFQIPGAQVLPSIPVAEAGRICRAVTDKDLHNNCVFDVATTGDEALAEGYLIAQELALYGTSVRITASPAPTWPNRSIAEPAAPPARRPKPFGSLVVTATVVPQGRARPTPTGSVTFFVDGMPRNRPIELDGLGRAQVTLGGLKPGKHRIRAVYSGGGRFDYHASSSANLVHVVAKKPDRDSDV